MYCLLWPSLQTSFLSEMFSCTLMAEQFIFFKSGTVVSFLQNGYIVSAALEVHETTFTSHMHPIKNGGIR